MNNLKGNALMREMSMSEMVIVNGGIAPIVLSKCVEFVTCLMLTECLNQDATTDFENGRVAAREFWGV